MSGGYSSSDSVSNQADEGTENIGESKLSTVDSPFTCCIIIRISYTNQADPKCINKISH
jgi:hypothetical protein